MRHRPRRVWGSRRLSIAILAATLVTVVSAMSPGAAGASAGAWGPTHADPKVGQPLVSPGGGDWWDRLRPGDIMFTWDSAFPSREGRTPNRGVFRAIVLYEHGHVGIYVGDGKTVEALGFREGVVLRDVNEWVTEYYGFSVLRVMTATDEQAAQAAANAVPQVGKRFKWLGLLYTKSPDLDQKYWYCTELVWGAYLDVGIDIQPRPRPTVQPWEIYYHPDIREIGGMKNGRFFWVEAEYTEEPL